MKRLFTLLSILLLVGCTITKRHFGPGYHVEWKKSHAKTENESYKLSVADSKQEYSIKSTNNEIVIEEVILIDSVNIRDPISCDNLEIPMEGQRSVSESQSERSNDSIKSELISNDEEPLKEQKRRVEPFTWISLGGLVLTIIFAILILTMSPMAIIWILATVHYFIFVIGSMISVVHIRRNPSKYKGKGFTWTLFALGLAAIVAAIAVTIYKTVEFFT